jgi:hypothetical protein
MTLADTLAQAKWTFVTRRVDPACVTATDTDFPAAQPGDLILAMSTASDSTAACNCPRGDPR